MQVFFCVPVVVMSEKEVLERRIRIKKKKMLDTPIQLSSQQEETIEELLCGHRSTFDSAFYRFSGFRVCEWLQARLRCCHRHCFNLSDRCFLSLQPMDRNTLPVSECNQSASEPLYACSLSSSSSSPSSSLSSSSLFSSFEKQDNQEGEQVQKSGVFTALPHVTDLTTYMIQDIISFSKSLRDFR